jgi:D-3-phosphoglycerate dehydrogenase / 2-oxoglutarate reductase
MKTVLLTDHPWPDVSVERSIIAAAGFELAAGPAGEAPSATEVAEVVARHDPVAILTCWAPVSAAAVTAPTQLAIVARLGVGLDNIAVAEATARGAWVTNVPDYCVDEVSDHAVGLVLAAYRGITVFDREVRQGRWRPGTAALLRLREATVGIIGYGRIGRMTARKLAAFGCRLLVCDPMLREPPSAPIEAVELSVLQASADVIILHLPLTSTTYHLVDDAFVARLGRRPLLVNVSRGGLVDNAALRRGLTARRLAGAALDVVEGEPDVPPELLARDDVIITPHVAFSSISSVLELRRRACEEVVRVLRGEFPRYPCNDPQSAGATRRS